MYRIYCHQCMGYGEPGGQHICVYCAAAFNVTGGYMGHPDGAVVSAIAAMFNVLVDQMRKEGKRE